MNLSVQAPEPLPYHREVRDYLKSHEPELWKWFASAQVKADYAESLRMELLKSTYRLDTDSHPELYRSVAEALAGLQLDLPVTLYQAQNSAQVNAALCFLPGEGHVVFCGPILTLLSAEELKSVIGHELAHYHLFEREGGEFHIADRLLQAVANDPRAAASHEQTARRFQLYTEIFADRGSHRVTGDLHAVVSSLVKIETGLSHVSAPGYLKQAEEIFARGKIATSGVSHPEAFIRTRALALWHEEGEAATERVTEMIEGSPALEDLDLIGQKRLAGATRHLLEHLLRPKWFQTPAAVGHAKLFFDDFLVNGAKNKPGVDGFKFSEASLREYVCYVLLDFVTADPELDELPLAAALELSRQVELDETFEKLVAKELKMKVRDVRRVKEHAVDLLAKAEVDGE